MIAKRILSFVLDLAFVHFLATGWLMILRTAILHEIPAVDFDNPVLLWAQSDHHLFLSLLIWFFYFLCFTALFSETPAMALFGLRLRRISGKSGPLGWRVALVRTLGLFFGALTLGLGMVPAMVSSSGRALHDCLSDSMVIRGDLEDIPGMESIQTL